MSVFSFVPVFGEEEKILNSLQYEAYSVLKTFGYLSDYYDEEKVAEQDYVVRAVFAELVYNSFNPSGIQSENVFFHDVPKNHYAFIPISTLTEMGLISVNEDRRFYPENYIKPVEAAKIILYALNYGTMCSFDDDWSAGVNRLANELKLYKGIKTGEKLSFADALVMIYNGLNSAMANIEIGNLQLSNESETYLERCVSIYSGKGILRGFDETGVFGETIGRNDVLIDDMYFNDFSMDLNAFLGKQVKYYYHESGGENFLLWVGDTQKSKEVKLEYIRDDVSFDKDNYSFGYRTGGGMRKTINIKRNASVIYNGAYLANNVVEKLSGDMYTLTLIASDGNNYDVVIIRDYENYIFESADIQNEILYLKSCDNSAGDYGYETAELRKYQRIDIILPDKSSGALTDIERGSVISVERAEDSSRIRLAVSTEKTAGTVSSSKAEDGYQILTVKDKSYTVYKRNCSLQADTGVYAEIKLDAYGFAAMSETGTGGVSFGYLIKVMFDDSEEAVYIKVFSAGNEMKSIRVAERVKIDNIKCKTSSDAYRELGGEYFQPQLIAFLTNGADEVCMIDRPADYNENSDYNSGDMLVRLNDFSSNIYVSFQNQLGKKLRIGGNTLLMSISSDVNDSAKDEYFGIGTAGNLSHQNSYIVEGYQYGMGKKEFADVILFRDFRLGSEYFLSTRVLVDEVSQSINDEDEVVYVIKGYHGNTYKELWCTPECSKRINSIHKGDVISVTRSVNGKIGDFKVVYGPGVQDHPINKNFIASGARTTVAYVNDVVGNSVYCGFDDGKTWEEIISPGNAQVFVYDSERDEVFKGTTMDLCSYKQVQDECSRIFVYIVNGEVRNFIVYK